MSSALFPVSQDPAGPEDLLSLPGGQGWALPAVSPWWRWEDHLAGNLAQGCCRACWLVTRELQDFLGYLGVKQTTGLASTFWNYFP